MKRIPLNEVFTTIATQWFFDPDQSPPQSNMCAPLAEAIRTANKYINDKEEEIILFMYIGKGLSTNYTGNSINFACSSNDIKYYSAIYAFNFINVAGTNDQVRLEYTGPQGDGAYSTYLSAYTPVINLIEDNSPYRLTSTNTMNPADLTFTSVAAPDFYFVVTLN